MNSIYKIYDKATSELVSIEDNLTVVRKMAVLTAEQTHKLFATCRVNTEHFSIHKY